jgi:hypothetical protein
MIVSAPYLLLQIQISMHNSKKHKMMNIPVLNSLFNSVKKKKEISVEIE